MSIKQDILDQLDGLIQEGNRLNASYRMVEMGQMESELPESDFRSFSTTTLAAIERIAGRNSEYYRSLPPADPNDPFTLPGYNNTKIPAMIGSLVALRQAVDKGFLISLESKLRANIHDDFLQQAKGSKIRRIGAMIGSPSDASEERQEITNAIIRWNAVNREKGIIIDPVKWETHATPGLQGRPQGMINEELIPISDILVAVFRSRAGSPTGKELSGTIEEIREFMRIGKYIVLYFYDGEVDIGKVDPDQIKTINEFKKEIQQHGLTASYNNINELREHIICHLTSIVGRLPAPDVAIGAITKTDHPEFDNMQVIVGNQLLEQEDRSRRVDEKVAEVLDETYRRLFRVYESVSSYVKVLEWSHELPKEEKLTLASNANHEFWDYFLLNRIYIPPRLYEQIRTMAGKLTDIANGFTSVRRREERGLVDGVENGWTTAFKAMENEAGPLFKSLVRQIQERLGIQDTEETDTTKQSGGDTIG